MTLPIVIPMEKAIHEKVERLAYIVNPNLIAWVETHPQSGSIIHMSGAPPIKTPIDAPQLDKLLERYKSVHRGT